MNLNELNFSKKNLFKNNFVSYLTNNTAENNNKTSNWLSVSQSSTISTVLPDLKLLESINLLKNIIDRLTKTSKYEFNRDLVQKKNDPSLSQSSSDSLDSLYALAKNSVTLSFKDYMLLQKSTSTPSMFSTNLIQNTSKTLVKNSTLINTSLKSNSFLLDMIQSFQNGTIEKNNFSFNTTTSLNDDTNYIYDYDPISNILESKNSSLLFGIAFFYSILIITSLTSNPLLIYVLLWRRKAQLKLIDIFVANLSLSDLFLTILNIPLCLIIYFSEQWPFGSLLCQLGTFSTSCFIYVNIFTMAYISIDRYFAVTRPLLISNRNCQLRKKSILFDNHTRHKIYIVLTFIWIIAILLSLPQFLFSKVSNNDKQSNFLTLSNKSDMDTLNILDDDLNKKLDFEEDPFKKCIIEYPYENMKNIMVILNFLSQYLLPSIVILHFYGKIIYHLYLNLNVEELMESPHNNNNNNNLNNANQLTEINKPKTSNSIKETNRLTRKKSRMRIEGLNRTKNLKKSIKTMIIIIALFLLSWLPIHLYRLATTFYPIIYNFFQNINPTQTTNIPYNYFSNSSNLDIHLNEYGDLTNLTNKEILINALKNIRDKSNSNGNGNNNNNNNHNNNYHINDTNNQNFKINTLHNRYVFFFCYLLAMTSVCYNPIVYFWMHKKFRTEVKNLFNRMICFRRKNNRRNNDNDIRNNTLRRTSLLPTSNIQRGSIQTTSTQIANSKQSKFSLLSKQSTLLHRSEYDRSILKNRKFIRKSSSKRRAAQPCYVSSFKIRNKRFSSLSSESTASSSRKSDY